ncbi:MAG TPA: ABC transporter ATP-binding protein [Hyphomicrobiales bacterium]|jgi:branched-chain amino acid transport system ATP-binding protein
MNELLHVQSVSKRFGGVVANENISLRVNKGEIVGLIGPNGSGKTTLFNSIVGYHPIDGGSIRFAGKEISALRVPEIARLGLLRTFQQTRIYPRMTCVENLVVSRPIPPLSLKAMFRRPSAAAAEEAAELLEFVGLYQKRHLRAGDLSFGQQKLLEFAMALINRPQMLLLDEPTAGINPTLINGLLERLHHANERLQITLLVIEHNMRVIMTLAQRIYCLAHGQLLAEGTPDQIRQDPRVLDAYLGAR